jgi:hypothetical protein
VNTKVSFFDNSVSDFAESAYQNSRIHNTSLPAFSITVLALVLSSGVSHFATAIVPRNKNFEFWIAYIGKISSFYSIFEETC